MSHGRCWLLTEKEEDRRRICLRTRPGLVNNSCFQKVFVITIKRNVDMGWQSFPYPTSAVRLAVSSQKVDGAREKYLAWLLPHPLYHKKLSPVSWKYFLRYFLEHILHGVAATPPTALWLSWKMGSKVVNFDKLFLHQFSTKIYQNLRGDVLTSKK